MIDVSTDAVIDRPVEVVADYAADLSHTPEWYTNITSVEWKTPPPTSVGSLVAFVARFLGRRLEYTYEVIEVEPRRRLVMRTSEGPFPMETTYMWEPAVESGTHMTLRNCGEPSGFGRLASPFMAGAVRRANRKDLQRLKSILETDAGREKG